MYIAVIADNIADRKQLERLLNRANDTVASETGTLYIDAFGDEKSFLSTAMRYELFFIDITATDDHGRNVIETLKEAGVPGKIAVCQPDGTPFSYQDAIDGLYAIDKPILTAPLHQLIREAHSEFKKTADAVAKVEIRSEKETHYIPVTEIMYAEETDHLVNVHLENGTVIPMLGDLNSFARYISEKDGFFYARNDIIVNSNFVLSKTKKEIVLTDHKKISLKRFPLFF